MREFEYKKLAVVVALSVLLLAFYFWESPRVITPTAVDSIELDEQSNRVLEDFLANLRNGELEQAYELTSENFQDKVGMEQFEKLAENTGMSNFVVKKWVTMDSSNQDFHSVIRAEFTDQDGLVHKLSFSLVDELTGLKITSISEDLSLEMLAGRFPQGEELESLLKNDIEFLLKTVEEKSYEKFYKSLSGEAQSVVSLSDIEDSLKNFEKENKNLNFEENSELVIGADFPMITKDGKVQVVGSYENSEYLVEFFLEYVYEWGWVLNGVDIDGQLIN